MKKEYINSLYRVSQLKLHDFRMLNIENESGFRETSRR